MRTCAVAVVALMAGLSGPLRAAGPSQVVDLAGRRVDPLAAPAGTVATVLVFTTTDCPISGRYAPEIQRLADRFASRGVRFTLVFPVANDTPALVKAHLAKFAYRMPAVLDVGHELVAFAQAQVTPEVAVVDARGRLAYVGRIDDRYIDFGRDRPAPTTHDLENALDAVVAGRPVAVPRTQAVGCILADLLGKGW